MSVPTCGDVVNYPAMNAEVSRASFPRNWMKVFLGGTCNGSAWRDQMAPLLNVGSFNPVVEDWTPDRMKEELRQREGCDVCLYVITPKMTGTYSIAEVVDDSNKRPDRTVLVRLRDDGDARFDNVQWKSLGAVADMVMRNGGRAFDSLEEAANYINELMTNKMIRDVYTGKDNDAGPGL
ncbi:hypothetical protein JKG47_02945 [Acidithiobacillus sp. MC6.1]|nr:hypothetical protein [Acidithiobacillus sp. MC6.1]